MTRVIGVLNAGSSSVKFSVFAVAGADLRPLYRGEFEGIGTAPHFFVRDMDGAIVADERDSLAEVASQEDAVHRIFTWVESHSAGLEVVGVGHRVVHGGPVYSEPVVIDGPTLDALAAFEPLAPSHQPHNLAPIRAVIRHRPGLTQVACFDTAFHRTAPLVADVYALPREYMDAGVRRYGFHGLSFEYVTHALRALDPVAAAGRVVIAHLGNGCSMAAVLAGKSLGDTMGFTALDGLPMGTRCGQIDPGVSDLFDAATGHVARPDGGPALQPLRPEGTVRRLQRHARPAGQRPTGRPARGRLLRRPHRPRARLARRGPERAGRPGVHRGHRRARRRDPRGSAATRPGWASHSTTRPTAGVAPESPRKGVPPRPGSSRPTKN